ncbi:PP2C family serine/threonine-protein phosphatase [Sphingomonas canadensis]|uniref:PP2C family serine/threonine-protein phosphatase n=1 Tax=Sphingomonas canadensis TaxID=1219257 RepID=A0ABW3H5Z5_9SPHN|nr:PP2C family serine/threonine-protein phosphatase [Sphingomonas canadensis]MCW3835763.1 protein phosphatase 2C domain-containing protein [Sphingomonas canadensis]
MAGPCHAADACEDHHRVHVTPGGVLIAVVSDGAGSARHGAEGARILCDHVAEALARLFPGRRLKAGALAGVPDAVAAGIEAARAAAGELAAERGLTIDAFHATLVGAVAVPGKGGQFFHIGDGAALALDAPAGRWLLSPPSNGEYADTTFFFTEQDWRENLRFRPIEPGYDTIFVMSDGVTDLGFKTNGHGPEPHMPFFEPIGRFLANASREEGELALRATLDSIAARERTADDKTLVWAQAR